MIIKYIWIGLICFASLCVIAQFFRKPKINI